MPENVVGTGEGGAPTPFSEWVQRWRLDHVALAGLLGLTVAGSALTLVWMLVGAPFWLYGGDVLSIAFAAFVGGTVVYFGGRKIRGLNLNSAVGLALAILVFGYSIEASKQLAAKNSLRQAVLSDIVSIVDTLALVEILTWIDERAPERANVASMFESDDGRADPTRQVARYRLERMSQFTSGEDYFATIEAVGSRISDLPEVAPVTRFYSLLRGSRDVARLQQRWTARAFDPDPTALIALMKTDLGQLRCIIAQVILAAEAAIKANGHPSDRLRTVNLLRLLIEARPIASGCAQRLSAPVP